MFNYVLKSIKQPTAATKGTAVYNDKTRGDFTVTFDKIPTEQEVYNKLISFKQKYPEGTPCTNEKNSYISKTLFPMVTFEGKGCVAFAAELSDAAFGDFPGRYSFDFKNVRAGDIIRLSDNNHSVIVLKVEGDKVTIAEGNYNRSVHWERTLSLSKAVEEWNYIITRYPQ